MTGDFEQDRDSPAPIPLGAEIPRELTPQGVIREWYGYGLYGLEFAHMRERVRKDVGTAVGALIAVGGVLLIGDGLVTAAESWAELNELQRVGPSEGNELQHRLDTFGARKERMDGGWRVVFGIPIFLLGAGAAWVRYRHARRSEPE